MLWFYYVPREFWCDENEQQNDKTSLESEAEIDYGFYFVQKMESLNSLKLIPASFLSIHLAGARVHIHIHHIIEMHLNPLKTFPFGFVWAFTVEPLGNKENLNSIGWAMTSELWKVKPFRKYRYRAQIDLPRIVGIVAAQQWLERQ